MENTQKLSPSPPYLDNNSDFSAFGSSNRYDWSLSDEIVKGHANSIKIGKKAVSIARMSKPIDGNNIYIGFDIIVKIACFVTSWKCFFFFCLFADMMSKLLYGFLWIFVSTGLFALRRNCLFHLYKRH